MKLLIIGATGNTGIVLLEMAMAAGHEVTAFVRDQEKLKPMLDSRDLRSPKVVVGDVADGSLLQDACREQGAVINAAGNVADGENFVQLMNSVKQGVEGGMGKGGRFWFFGGAAALDAPGKETVTVDLPKVPAVFRSHKRNYLRAKASSLNWSMLCPGPMIASSNGHPHDGLRISTDTWPVPAPRLTRYLPRIALSLAFKNANAGTNDLLRGRSTGDP